MPTLPLFFYWVIPKSTQTCSHNLFLLYLKTYPPLMSLPPPATIPGPHSLSQPSWKLCLYYWWGGKKVIQSCMTSLSITLTLLQTLVISCWEIEWPHFFLYLKWYIINIQRNWSFSSSLNAFFLVSRRKLTHLFLPPHLLLLLTPFCSCFSSTVSLNVGIFQDSLLPCLSLPFLLEWSHSWQWIYIPL